MPDQPFDPPIYVARPDLPPLAQVIPELEKIWASRVLTNGGPYHERLERELERYLGVPHVSLFNNGTIALIVALKALDLQGEVITTPYSFVATTNAILWAGLKPVFVDVEPRTFNLDPDQIERAITPQTCAILPVHCYGNPCDCDAIEAIAARHALKVVYDAAHAFGMQCHCGSVLQHGDLSVLSLHATKVFNTLEGGAIVSHDAETKARIDRLKNFGFAGEGQVLEPGLNGKMNEIQAAIGLLQLPRLGHAIEARKEIDALYREHLAGVKGIRCVEQTAEKPNYSYFPIIVEEDYPLSRDEVWVRLRAHGVVARRYFWPILTALAPYGRETADHGWPIAAKVADQVLCLPIWTGLEPEQQARVWRALIL